MIHISAAQFEDFVQEAIDGLPDWVHQHLDNVAIHTAQWPSGQQQQAARLPQGHMLLGLYEGVPLSRRGHGYHLHAPDRITLFQRALEMQAPDAEALIAMIGTTIIHEIGHHFGLSEDELRQAGV